MSSSVVRHRTGGTALPALPGGCFQVVEYGADGVGGVIGSLGHLGVHIAGGGALRLLAGPAAPLPFLGGLAGGAQLEAIASNSHDSTASWVMSFSGPPVRGKRKGLPKPSIARRTLALNPPGLRPRACCQIAPSFLRKQEPGAFRWQYSVASAAIPSPAPTGMTKMRLLVTCQSNLTIAPSAWTSRRPIF